MLEWVGPLQTCIIKDREGRSSKPWPPNVPKELHLPVFLRFLAPPDNVRVDVIDFGHGKPQVLNGSQSTRYQKLILRQNSTFQKFSSKEWRSETLCRT